MNIYDQLEQRRKQVLGKNYTPIPTGTGSSSPGSVESFQARRQQILSQGSQVAQTPVKKITASAPLTVQPKSLIQQAEGAVGAAVSTVSNVLRLNPKQKTVPLTQIPHSTDLNTNPMNSPSAQMTVTPQSLQSQQKAQKLGDKAVAVQNRFRDTYLEMQNQVGDALKDFRPFGAPAYAPANEGQPGNIKELKARDDKALKTGVTPERINKDLGIFTLKLTNGASFGVLSAISNGAPEKNEAMTPEGKKIGGVADIAGQLAFISPKNLLKFVAVSKTFDVALSKITGKNSLADFVPEDNEGGKIVATALEFLSKAFITHKLNGELFKNAREVLTKNMVTQYGMPEMIRISPEGVQNVVKGFDTGINKDVLSKLNMTSKEWKTAAKEGAWLDIPTEKAVLITDKPIWAKLKSYMGIPADERTIPIARGKIGGFGGYLESGQNDPQDVINAVIKAGEETTPAGREAIRKAVGAKKDGSFVTIVNSSEPKEAMALEKNIQEYRSFGGYTQGTQTENAALRDIYKDSIKPEVKKYTQEKVNKAIDDGKIKINDDGTVTLYRGGEPSKTDNLMSATYDKSVAQVFADNSGTEVTEIKVQPSEIRAFIGKAEAEVLLKNPNSPEKYDYQSTQLDLPKEEASKIVSFGNSIPKSALSTGNNATETGLETDSHITVLYGLSPDVNAVDIKDLLGSSKPITVTLGKTSLFENEDQDILKVDVNSPELTALNKKLQSNLDVPGQTHADYKPHITVAYLKKGQGKKFVGDTRFEGQKITLNELAFSNTKGEKVVVPLSGEEKPMTPVKDVVEKKMSALQQKKELRRQQDIVDNKPKKEQKVLSGSEVKAVREVINAKIEAISQLSNDPKEYVKGIDSLVKYVEERGGDDKQVLSALRTELNKEMYGIAGAGGNYKQAYAILQTMKEDPDTGESIKKLEDTIAKLDEKLVTSAVKPEKTEKSTFNEKKPVTNAGSETKKEQTQANVTGKGSGIDTQTPVGEGKLRQSQAFKHLMDHIEETNPELFAKLQESGDEKLMYNKVNQEYDFENAVKLVQEDPQRAYRIAKSYEEPPAGQRQTSVAIVLQDQALREGNIPLWLDLEKTTSFLATRRGQENVAFKGRYSDNSPHSFVRELLSRRLEAMGKNITGDLKKELLSKKPGKTATLSPKEAAIGKIDKQAEELQKVIRARTKKEAVVMDVQKFIDDLICK